MYIYENIFRSTLLVLGNKQATGQSYTFFVNMPPKKGKKGKGKGKGKGKDKADDGGDDRDGAGTGEPTEKEVLLQAE